MLCASFNIFAAEFEHIVSTQEVLRLESLSAQALYEHNIDTRILPAMVRNKMRAIVFQRYEDECEHYQSLADDEERCAMIAQSFPPPQVYQNVGLLDVKKHLLRIYLIDRAQGYNLKERIDNLFEACWRLYAGVVFVYSLCSPMLQTVCCPKEKCFCPDGVTNMYVFSWIPFFALAGLALASYTTESIDKFAAHPKHWLK